jgi:hypothetical protein
VPVEQKITLQVLLQPPDRLHVTFFKGASPSVFESTVKSSRLCPFHAGLVSERAREIFSLLARANAGAPDLLAPLVAEGRNLYDDLLPAFVKDKLSADRIAGEHGASRSLVLHLDRPLLGIPWELLHDGVDFLARRFRVGRLVSLEQEVSLPLKRNMRAPLSALLVADPSGNLPAARREAGELAEILEDSPLFGRVTVLAGDVSVRSFRDELGRHDVLHYAGHADAGGAGDGGGRLFLKDGALTTGMLVQLRQRVDFPGLVFLNGCRSSDDTGQLFAGGDPLADMSSIASALLLCGVQHVIGTLWEVRDDVARQCATSFYRELGRGGTIGASLAASRQAVSTSHGEESLLWADHLLYGDPTWRAVQPANAALEDFDALDGLEQKYRTELQSAPESSTRLLAAAMLLRLGDRTVVPALGKELATLEAWLAPDAAQRDRRRAGLVVQALASAAGLAPTGPPEELPDADAVRSLLVRLLRG